VTTPNPEDLLSTAEAAEVMDVSRRRVQALCKEGRLGLKVGRAYVIPRAQAEAFEPNPVGRPPKDQD
jgi:excisionase family DNA binding protein